MFKYKGPLKSKRPLKPNDKTLLWICRMVVGEGGRHCSTKKVYWLCTSIVNRWFLWPGSRYYLTFIRLMRAFSQPINPRWMIGGDLAEKWRGKPAASKRRLRRRAKISRMTIDQIPQRIRIAVKLFLLNGIGIDHDHSVRPSNWASLPSTPTKFPHGRDVDGDWFFEDANLRRGRVIYVAD